MYKNRKNEENENINNEKLVGKSMFVNYNNSNKISILDEEINNNYDFNFMKNSGFINDESNHSSVNLKNEIINSNLINNFKNKKNKNKII